MVAALAVIRVRRLRRVGWSAPGSTRRVSGSGGRGARRASAEPRDPRRRPAGRSWSRSWQLCGYGAASVAVRRPAHGSAWGRRPVGGRSGVYARAYTPPSRRAPGGLGGGSQALSFRDLGPVGNPSWAGRSVGALWLSRLMEQPPTPPTGPAPSGPVPTGPAGVVAAANALVEWRRSRSCGPPAPRRSWWRPTSRSSSCAPTSPRSGVHRHRGRGPQDRQGPAGVGLDRGLVHPHRRAAAHGRSPHGPPGPGPGPRTHRHPPRALPGRGVAGAGRGDRGRRGRAAPRRDPARQGRGHPVGGGRAAGRHRPGRGGEEDRGGGRPRRRGTPPAAEAGPRGARRPPPPVPLHHRRRRRRRLVEGPRHRRGRRDPQGRPAPADQAPACGRPPESRGPGRWAGGGRSAGPRRPPVGRPRRRPASTPWPPTCHPSATAPDPARGHHRPGVPARHS